jgi:hypothetical protein
MFATKAGMAAFRSLRRSGFEGMIRTAVTGSPEADGFVGSGIVLQSKMGA